jgi:hypothetical protein
VGNYNIWQFQRRLSRPLGCFSFFALATPVFKTHAGAPSTGNLGPYKNANDIFVLFSAFGAQRKNSLQIVFCGATSES